MAVNIREGLNRHELPIQSVSERSFDLTATVPVNATIFQLTPQARLDRVNLQGAHGTVSRWFNEDMEYHLECLRQDGGADATKALKGYERFSNDWSLVSTLGEGGFLQLHWRKPGQTQSIGLSRVPIILYNALDKDHGFYTPEKVLDGKTVEVLYRSVREPEIVFMNPEKMKQFAKDDDPANIKIGTGKIEVRANGFCSDYQTGLDAMPKALLLRDFAVFYLNRLLDAWQKKLH